MAGPVTGSFDTPDSVQELNGLRQEVVHLGDVTMARTFHPVGWRWSTHVKPVVGTPSCQARHVGFVLSGLLGVLLDDGRSWEVAPGEVFDFPPGHDGYVAGNEPVVAIEWVGVSNWMEAPQDSRALVALLFTDIVDSTSTLSRVGDRAWRNRLVAHNEIVRRALSEHHGHELQTTCDGFLAYFEGRVDAVAAAVAIRRGVAGIDVPVHQGVHFGEVRLADGDFEGLAVHEAARTAAAAGAGEIFVSEVTKMLTGTAGFTFESRGEQTLKGLDAPRILFAVT
jgi:class 3 adenylate cyclase